MEINKVLTSPDVTAYDCYRKVLRDFFLYKKSLRAGFSYRQFSMMCGFKSPNYLQLVISHKRNLSTDAATQIAKSLRLKSSESDYFLALVEKENAQTLSETNLALRRLFRAARTIKSKFIETEQKEILSEWHHFAVRELVLLKDFEPSGEYISNRLSGLITVDEAGKSLRLLLATGFLKQQNGKLQQADPVLDTGLDLFQHSFMQQYHAKLLQSWSEHIEKLGPKGQELGILNIPIPSDKIPELQKKIRQFQDEIIGWAQDFKDTDQFVQLGTYLMVYHKKEK